jgi:FkbM family methyltransferase
MTFVSYAQNFEDVMLYRALGDIEKGFYIDVGAFDPVIDSVTKAFYDIGWRGINIEPVTESFDKIKSSRPDDININIAAGASRENQDFYEIVGTGLSTMAGAIAHAHVDQYGFEMKHYEVPVDTITSVWSENGSPEVHFLKIDVEGTEKEVLQGIDFRILRPWIIVVEATLPNTQSPNYNKWEALITDQNYQFIYFDGLNRFYVADEHSSLGSAFATPPNYFDNFIRADKQALESRVSEIQSALDRLTERNDNLQINDTISPNIPKEFVEKTQSIAQAAFALLSEKEIILHNTFSALDDSRRHNENNLSEILHLTGQNKDLQNLLQNSETKYLELENELKITNNELKELRVRFADLKKHSTDQDDELNANQLKIAELNYWSHTRYQEATQLSQQLDAVYNSKSWLITLPLRKSSLLFGKLMTISTKHRESLFKTIKQPFRELLVTAMRFIRNNKKLRDKSMALLIHFPKLKSHLQALYRISNSTGMSHKLTANNNIQSSNSNSSIGSGFVQPNKNELPESSLRVYQQLKMLKDNSKSVKQG